MARSKSKVFKAIREVCGPEICPAVQRAEKLGADMECVAATAHQMRHALAATLLMLSNPHSDLCPNCEKKTSAHADKCSVGRMLAAVRVISKKTG